jgi:glycosyltransferase involved in cell wall biosynthesis
VTRKLLWHSVAPWCPTGYGVQTSLFTSRLAAQDGIDLAISTGFGLEGRAIKWDGLHVYPGEDWNRTALQWAIHHGQGEPCTVITLMDVWPLDRRLFRAIAEQGPLACWVPIDHKPAPSIVTDFFHATEATPIAMSRFGHDELRAAGFDPLYVPHGVDTAMFKPMNRTEIRSLFGFPEDAFVVGIVANNQGVAPPRKAFSESFMAFSEFLQDHTDACLYLHSETSGFRNGIDLHRLAARFEIPDDKVRVTDQVMMENGIPAGVMAGLYNSFDVLLNPSYGEGFGVPVLEAQACGTPVIVTDWTAMPELCGAGWTVGGRLWDDPKQEAFFMAPDVGEIVVALEAAYHARGDDELRTQAVEFAAQYDADRVLQDHWLPALDQLWAPKEVQPLRPLNREMRRKMKVAS